MVQVPHRPAIDGRDDIPGLNPCGRRWPIRIDADHERSPFHGEIIGVGDLGRDTDRLDASGGADHAPRGDQRGQDRFRGVHGDGEADAVSRGDDAVLIPMTRPVTLMSGPPELPALMAASVWIRLWSMGRPTCSLDRPPAHTTPTDTVGPTLDPQRVADRDDRLATLAPETGAYALRHLRGLNSDPHVNISAMNGVVAGALFNLEPEGQVRVTEEKLAELTANLRKTVDTSAVSSEKLTNELRTAIAEARAASGKALKELSAQAEQSTVEIAASVSANRTAVEEFVNSSKTDWENIKATFSKDLALHSAVTYWKKKGFWHRAMAGILLVADFSRLPV